MYALAEKIKSLSKTGISLLHQDVIYRIGSHMAGGNPDMNYIKQQENILGLIQAELERRNRK